MKNAPSKEEPAGRPGRGQPRGWTLAELFRNRRKERPLFSIVIPVYEAAEKLERSIQSILREPAELWELSVIDAASEDGTLDVLRRHQGRLHWISERDSGVYDAMNKGIAHSKAPYLYFLGAGDTLRPGILAKVARRIPRNRAGFVYGNVYMHDKQVIWDGKWTPEKFRTRTPCQQAIFYDRRIFAWHGGFEWKFKTMADYAMNIRCFGDERIRKIFIDEVIADYEGGGFSANCRDDPFYDARPELLRRCLGVEQKKSKKPKA